MNDWKTRIICSADDEAAWLAARGRYFTGSNAATLMGEHEYTTLDKLRQEKITGESDFNAEQDHVVQGQLAEPFVAAYYSRATGRPLERVAQLVRHPTCDVLAATPDYLENGKVNVQIKWTLSSDWGHGRVPRYIWWQVQLEMVVLGVTEGMVVAYHRRKVPKFGRCKIGDQLGIYPIEYDSGALDSLIAAAEEHKGMLL